MRYSSILALIVALCLTGAAGFVGVQYARGIEAEFAHPAARWSFPAKNQGVALQRQALQEPDLLAVYGSSELTRDEPNMAPAFFNTYPTGFGVDIVGNAGTEPLLIAENLAAIGPDLRGRKVVVILSPPWFVASIVTPESYAGNFSPLHAYDLVASPDLRFTFKQQIAQQMLRYPNALAGDPVLRFALEKLADSSVVSRIAYVAVLPVVEIEKVVLQLQDHWNTVQYVEKNRKDLTGGVGSHPGLPNWPALRARALSAEMKNTDRNPFGVENSDWVNGVGVQVLLSEDRSTDAQFLQHLNTSPEWTNLDLVLQVLEQFGAQPLIFSLPLEGTYYDFAGVSRQARQAYYQHIRDAVKPYGYPVLDFADQDGNKYFEVGVGSHLSQFGWVYVDQVLDDFYHGKMG